MGDNAGVKGREDLLIRRRNLSKVINDKRDLEEYLMYVCIVEYVFTI